MTEGLRCQVFARVVDPENPVQFEELYSDEDETADDARPDPGVREYGPFLPEKGGSEEAGICRASASADGVAVAKTGGCGSRAAARGGGQVRARRRRLAVDDPDELMVSSDGDSGDEGEEEEGDASEASDDDEEEAPQADAGWQGRGSAGALRGGQGARASEADAADDSEETESDDGLVAYEMDDSDSDDQGQGSEGDDDEEGGAGRIGRGRVPLPTTLQQCLAGLRSSNADEVEAAVWALPELASRSPDLSGEICCEVAAVLLRLEDRIAMDDFATRRHRGLVALACADPTHVAPRLSQAVWYLVACQWCLLRRKSMLAGAWQAPV